MEREQLARKPTTDERLQRLVLEFAAPLYRYAFRLTGRVPDAEDLVQQTFLVAHSQFEQLRDPSRVSAWLHAILRNAWCKLCRRNRVHGTALAALEANARSSAEVNDGIDRERVQAALNDLPEEFRLVVLMFYFEDLSYQEIAEQLLVPIGTVMSRLSRAKQHLRRRLDTEASFRTSTPRIRTDVSDASGSTSIPSLTIS